MKPASLGSVAYFQGYIIGQDDRPDQCPYPEGPLAKEWNDGRRDGARRRLAVANAS